MKRLLLPILVILLTVLTVQAQEPATHLETLNIDLWPDFDQPSVLILLTGQLSANVSLPAQVTLPLPPEATLNVVARITSTGNMIDDLVYETTADSVTFTLPDRQFRVEYYVPYQAQELNRNFSFTWLANLTVNRLRVTVQQPATAASLTITPAPMRQVSNTPDGLTYHLLPELSVPAGEPYQVQLAYTLTAPVLTINADSTNQTTETAVSTPTTTNTRSTFNIPTILVTTGLFLIVIALIWGYNSRRQTPRPKTKPAPKRQARYCHQCGHKLRPNDKFCRECGTAVR